MEKNKQIIAGLSILVIVLLGLLIYSSKSAKLNNEKKTEVPQSELKKASEAFVLATVSKVEKNKLTLKNGSVEMIALTTDQTEYAKEVRDKEGNRTVAPAKASDVKVNAEVLVYYAPAPGDAFSAQSNELKVTKIEIQAQ